jgi:uncharacterized protein YciI
MTTFAVRYTYGDDTAGRDEHRPKHIAFLESQYDAKRLLLSGPLVSDDNPGALLIFSGESVEDVGKLLDGDPFMRNGFIADREIRQWNPVFGKTRLES